MSRGSHAARPLVAVAGHAFLSAALALALFAPSRLNARDPPKKHGAISGAVAVDGKLVRTPGAPSGWAIELTAVSQSAAETPCNVEASLLSVWGAPLSRVRPRAQLVWKEGVTMRVPARGNATARIALPAQVAADVADSEAWNRKNKTQLEKIPNMPRLQHSVAVEATCTSGLAPVS